MNTCFLLTLFTCVTLVLSGQYSPNHDFYMDSVCSPVTGKHVPFTGFRLMRLWRPFKSNSFCKLVYCRSGLEMSSDETPMDDSSVDFDYIFRLQYPSYVNACFKISRRKKYTGSLNRWLSFMSTPSNSLIGGLFQVPCTDDQITNDQAIPVAPMLTDGASNIATGVYDKHQYFIFPLLQSADSFSLYFSNVTEWANYIDINEEYSSSI